MGNYRRMGTLEYNGEMVGGLGNVLGGDIVGGWGHYSKMGTSEDDEDTAGDGDAAEGGGTAGRFGDTPGRWGGCWRTVGTLQEYRDTGGGIEGNWGVAGGQGD